MKKTKRNYYIPGLLIVVLLGAGFVFLRQYYNPLGPVMSLSDTGANVAEGKSNPSSTAVLTAETPTKNSTAPSPTIIQPQPPIPITAPSAVPTEKTFCGQTGKTLIMVVGDDADPGLPPPGADLIRYIQVDYDRQLVTIFAFPRGLWVNSRVLADQQINATTLGKTFYYAQLAAKSQDPEPKEEQQILLASQAVAQTVLDNFGLKPDHYVAVKVSNLPKLVDAVGGVTVDNPYSFTTDKYDKVYTFATGEQTLNGLQTAAYVRYISATHSDWDRIARQNLVLQSLNKKLQDPATLPKIPGFFTELADSIVTDLSAENITDFTCVLKSLPADHILHEQVSPDMLTQGPEAGSQLPDVEKIKELLKSLNML
jgi:LCP family protein required for cell wall assembly